MPAGDRDRLVASRYRSIAKLADRISSPAEGCAARIKPAAVPGGYTEALRGEGGKSESGNLNSTE